MKKLFGTAALAFMLCLTGLVISGTALGGGGGQCEDNGDETVTDNGTGLIWQKATAGPMNWHQAMSYASSLTLGGNSNWRPPNKDELIGLFNSPCKDMMNVIMCGYWSSTTDAYEASLLAWRIHFSDGRARNINKSGNNFYVRAVRSAQ